MKAYSSTEKEKIRNVNKDVINKRSIEAREKYIRIYVQKK